MFDVIEGKNQGPDSPKQGDRLGSGAPKCSSIFLSPSPESPVCLPIALSLSCQNDLLLIQGKGKIAHIRSKSLGKYKNTSKTGAFCRAGG